MRTLEHRCADATGLFVDIPQACPEIAGSDLLNVSGPVDFLKMDDPCSICCGTDCVELQFDVANHIEIVLERSLVHERLEGGFVVPPCGGGQAWAERDQLA